MGTAGLTGADSRGYLGDAEIMAAQLMHGDLHGWAWLGSGSGHECRIYPWLVTLNISLFGNLAPLTTVLMQGVDRQRNLPARLSNWEIDRPAYRLACRYCRRHQSDADRAERDRLYGYAVRVLCRAVSCRRCGLVAPRLVARSAHDRPGARVRRAHAHRGGALGAGHARRAVGGVAHRRQFTAASLAASRGDLRALCACHRADPGAQCQHIRRLVPDQSRRRAPRALGRAAGARSQGRHALGAGQRRDGKARAGALSGRRRPIPFIESRALCRNRP